MLGTEGDKLSLEGLKDGYFDLITAYAETLVLSMLSVWHMYGPVF